MDIDDCLRKLVDEAADGILIADEDGIVRFWNPGAARIFGFTSQEAVVQSLDIIIPAALRARHWHGYAESIRTGQTHYGAGDLLAVPALRKDRARISIEFSIVHCWRPWTWWRRRGRGVARSEARGPTVGQRP